MFLEPADYRRTALPAGRESWSRDAPAPSGAPRVLPGRQEAGVTSVRVAAVDERADVLAAQDLQQLAGLAHVEHAQRQVAVAG